MSVCNIPYLYSRRRLANISGYSRTVDFPECRMFFSFSFRKRVGAFENRDSHWTIRFCPNTCTVLIRERLHSAEIRMILWRVSIMRWRLPVTMISNVFQYLLNQHRRLSRLGLRCSVAQLLVLVIVIVLSITVIGRRLSSRFRLMLIAWVGRVGMQTRI